MSSGAVNKQGGLSNQDAIRIKVDGPSGDDSASGSGSSSDSSNESDEESDGRRKSRRNKTKPAPSNTSNSFFSNNIKDKRHSSQSMMMKSGSNSLPGNNSLLSYRNNESTFKTDEEDNGAGADKASAVGLSSDKAQDSDSAQNSLIASLIDQTKQKFLPKSSKRKAEKLSKKQRKQQEKEQRLKEGQERKLKQDACDTCLHENDIKEDPAEAPKSAKEKAGTIKTNKLHNGSSDKLDNFEGEIEVKTEEDGPSQISTSERKKPTKTMESDDLKSVPVAPEMQNGKEDSSKRTKKSDASPTKHSAKTRSVPLLETLEPLTTSTAETGTTGASSTAGTATTTSATDTNTDNATTTEDDDDDIPLAAKKSRKSNSKKKGKLRGSLSRAAKMNSASENESQEEMEIVSKVSNKNDCESKEKSISSPTKVNKPKGLVDSLSKYFTPGGRRAVTSRTALSSLIGSSSSPTRRSADSALTMIHSANANSTDGFGMKRKRVSAAAFLSGSSDGEDMDESSQSLTKAAKKSKRNKSLDSASHGPSTIASLKKSAAGTSSAHSDSETGTGGLHDRKRHTSGGGQLRSLYDGLSHLYTDCDSRLRHIPSTNYAPEKRRKLTDLQESGIYPKFNHYSNLPVFRFAFYYCQMSTIFLLNFRRSWLWLER